MRSSMSAALVCLIITLSNFVDGFPDPSGGNGSVHQVPSSLDQIKKKSSARADRTVDLDNRHPWQVTCSQDEMKFQFENIDMVDCSICDSETAWQLAHQSLPRATVFFDMGANLGYTAAKMFGLWSPGHGLNRQSLMKYLKADNRTSSNSVVQLSTVCADGLNPDTPLICPGLYRQYHGNPGNAPPCSYRNEIRVYSFDGESRHARNTRAVIDLHLPHLSADSSVNDDHLSQTSASTSGSVAPFSSSSPSHSNNISDNTVNSRITADRKAPKDFRRARWEYINAAVIGNHTMHNKTGYFQQLGHEGSRFDGFNPPGKFNPFVNKTIAVPVITIDGFCQDRGITVLDVLKLDIEGNEVEALMKGATYTLSHRRVQFLTYECLNDCGGGTSMDLIKHLDKLGFMCYMNGRNDLMVRITGCWNGTYAHMENPQDFAPSEQRVSTNRLAGNVYCGHRTRSPQLVAAFESLSLHTFYGDRRGDIYEGGLLGRPAWVAVDKDSRSPPKNSHSGSSSSSQKIQLAEPGRMEQWARATGRNITTGKRIRLHNGNVTTTTATV